MYASENENGYWQNELSSLGKECKRNNELNDNSELETLAIAIKEVYFQDYKTAYDNRSTEIIDESQFEYIIQEGVSKALSDNDLKQAQFNVVDNQINTDELDGI